MLKSGDFVREIVIQEKKSKPPLILLYSKNHEDDDIEKMKLEERTPELLRKYWNNIEKEDQIEKKKTKVSAIHFLNKNQKKKSTKRRSWNRDSENVYMWRNYSHLNKRIQKGLKKLEARKATKKLKQ